MRGLLRRCEVRREKDGVKGLREEAWISRRRMTRAMVMKREDKEVQRA